MGDPSLDRRDQVFNVQAVRGIPNIAAKPTKHPLDMHREALSGAMQNWRQRGPELVSLLVPSRAGMRMAAVLRRFAIITYHFKNSAPVHATHRRQRPLNSQ